MAIADNKRLYDIATRSQAYVENVKIWQAHEFDLFLIELSEELRKLLPHIKHKTLDALTKAQLNTFLIELRKTQGRLYSLYLDRTLTQLEDFMRVSLEVSRRVFATAYGEDSDEEETINDDEEAEAVLFSAEQLNTFGFLFGVAAVTSDPPSMWAKIKNAPLPANGMYMQPFLKGFTNSAQAAVENAVRKAYANGDSVEALTGAIFNRSAQGTSGILQRIGQQGAAALATSMQHIAQIVSAGITSGLYGRYRWYSVIDNATTAICLSRDGNIYKYGEGPIPPAHIGCRSHIAPVSGEADVPDETFTGWFKRQSSAFRDDFKPGRALTPNGYLGKVALILSR